MFVVLEGGEGAGKSTLAAALAASLRARGHEVVVTREPGGTAAGETVRMLLHEPLVPWAETFAFLAARAQLVAEVIRPALERGAVVICDRFAASTFAYQGFGRGLPLDDLLAVNRIATAGLEPDLVIFLDLAPELGLARKHGEIEAIRTGLESRAFHERVRDGYRMLAAGAPARSWLTIDAALPQGEVAARALAEIHERSGRTSG